VTLVPPSGARKRVYAARIFTDRVMNALAERYELTANEADRPIGGPALAAAADGCDYLFVSVTERVDAGVIEALSPKLRVIATLSVGVDHIDLEAARRHGIAVVYTPDVLSAACGELAWLLILGAARRGYEADALVRSGQWEGWAPTQLLGVGLEGRRLGIFGLGRIGREVAKRATGFGMTVHYHNRRRLEPGEESGALYHATADELLAASDILCLCAPGSGGTTGFLTRERIALMPENAIVVNISRGDLVDDDALIEALTSRRLFAAGLDVFRGEPALDPRYRALANAFLTPHIGSATVDTRDGMGFMLLDGVAAIERGDTPANRIA
jgi:lactate dehydrogenase-like 2-hydroxyacid dehydrogenase